jgi:hypothetical protein
VAKGVEKDEVAEETKEGGEPKKPERELDFLVLNKGNISSIDL